MPAIYQKVPGAALLTITYLNRYALPRSGGSQSERLRHSPGQVILAHRGVDLDDGQVQGLRLLVEAFGEHAIALEQVAQGSLRIAGLAGDVPRRAPAVEGGPPEAGRREEPDGLT